MNPRLIEKLNGLKVQGADAESREVNYRSSFDVQKEVIKADIKTKLIEQLTFLEEIQSLAKRDNRLKTAVRTSEVMLNYLLAINMLDEDVDDDCDYICPDCEEALVKEIEAQEIANASDLPIELVKRVLSAMDEVSDNY